MSFPAAPRPAGFVQWPAAEVVEVVSHLQIPELHGDETVSRWVQIRTNARPLPH